MGSHGKNVSNVHFRGTPIIRPDENVETRGIATAQPLKSDIEVSIPVNATRRLPRRTPFTFFPRKTCSYCPRQSAFLAAASLTLPEPRWVFCPVVLFEQPQLAC